MSKDWREFNLNTQVKIKLKPKGMIHLLEIHKKIMGEYGEYVPRLDSDGYYSTSLWNFANEFGEVTNMGSAQNYYDINILIDCKALQLPTPVTNPQPEQGDNEMMKRKRISQEPYPYYPLGKRAGYLPCEQCGYHHDIKTEPCVPSLGTLWNEVIDLREAFDKFATHNYPCHLAQGDHQMIKGTTPTCSCGLDDLRTDLEKSIPPKDNKTGERRDE